MNYYCFIVLLFFSQFVQARMYQWIDPESGTTQLSGKPPTWYRGVEGGPRVFVFEQGKVVDDTGIEISSTQRISLRTKAFLRAEKDRLMAKEKAMEVAKVKAITGRKMDGMVSSNEADEFREEVISKEIFQTKVMKKNKEEKASVEKMKALISEWENKRTEEAQTILEQDKGGT